MKKYNMKPITIRLEKFNDSARRLKSWVYRSIYDFDRKLFSAQKGLTIIYGGEFKIVPAKYEYFTEIMFLGIHFKVIRRSTTLNRQI